ncbi:hypothetical protein V8C34DRAFT_45 [Trichoderma compactum]
MAFVSSPFLLCLVPISFFQITLTPAEPGGKQAAINDSTGPGTFHTMPFARKEKQGRIGRGTRATEQGVACRTMVSARHLSALYDVQRFAYLASIWTEYSYMRCPATTGWLEVFRPEGISKSDGVASRLLSKLADLVLPALGCNTESCFHGRCRSELQGRILSRS